MPTKILVTGATGFIGSRLCELLSLEYRLPYRALVRDFSRAVRIARLDTELVAGDMLDAASLARAVEGCDAVVNLAHGDDESARTQVTQLIEACTRAGVRRFVHISSMAVHGPSPQLDVLTEATAPIQRWNEAYSDAKAASEAVVVAAGKRGALETVVLRPTIVYGPYSFFVTPIVQDARAGRISLIDGGRGICNAVYVDDVCEAIMAALERDDAVGAAFLINGDTRMTWGDFITTFAGMVEGEKTLHDHSLDEIASYWQAKRPRARDSVTAAIRLAASPAFHAQLGTIPPVGKLIRGTKEMVARRITAEQKMMIKSRLQRRSTATPADDVPALRMPSEGRVVREAYRSWVSNDLARTRLGWTPTHSFELGARRTGEWMRFARIV
ncbi:NAD-dependent epimerase/dehydratase family protein [Pseudoxanthomonas sp. PXM03]|uniref:NAD-dependent epimerase/dehydratase family protein n=1 Tax=Pseudoxanthomonas sp. PXM03 TaxID=2769284 RepID=UPI0017809358|nr:NAD-dependent epimerase/dehydratase family protein [Pseudoxanthomonas sp. PXM03]MBD9438074.1 NAD-dependent epimerase/dehydratase family protein [Pseudoxanthomonas sp. PXM03]